MYTYSTIYNTMFFVKAAQCMVDNAKMIVKSTEYLFEDERD